MTVESDEGRAKPCMCTMRELHPITLSLLAADDHSIFISAIALSPRTLDILIDPHYHLTALILLQSQDRDIQSLGLCRPLAPGM